MKENNLKEKYDNLTKAHLLTLNKVNKYKFYAIFGWSLLIFFMAANIVFNFYGIN